MFAITVSLIDAQVAVKHPVGASQAYTELRDTLEKFGFEMQERGFYTTQRTDLGNLYAALLALKALPWFPVSVRQVRMFEVAHWSDVTALARDS